MDELQSIGNTLKVDLVIANETHLEKDKFKLEGLKSFICNRQDAAMDGRHCYCDC